jgi:hypothetical protein
MRTEVVNALFKVLPPADQICFALSCRSLYNQFLAFLRAQNQWAFQLCPLGKRPALFRNIDSETRPRTDLLRRLENKRWRYCSGCWKLHPRSAWRIPLSKKQLLFQKPYCMPYAGRVDLCPCMTITFPDLDHLIGTLKIARQGYARTHYYDGLLENIDRVSGTLRHDCTFKSHPAANVHVITTLNWDYKRKRLIATSQYEFELDLQAFSQRHLHFVGINTSLLCSRRNIKTWLRRFFNEAGSSFSGWRKSCLVDASLSHHDAKEPKSEDVRMLTITTSRKLGSGQWPDLTWMLSSRR